VSLVASQFQVCHPGFSFIICPIGPFVIQHCNHFNWAANQICIPTQLVIQSNVPITSIGLPSWLCDFHISSWSKSFTVDFMWPLASTCSDYQVQFKSRWKASTPWKGFHLGKPYIHRGYLCMVENLFMASGVDLYWLV